MDPGLISLIGVLLSLSLLIYLAYKGFPILFLSIISMLPMILLSGGNINELIQENYMTGFANFAQRNWLIFFFSAVFGQMMGDSGAAKVIAYTFAGFARKFPGKEQLVAILTLIFISSTLSYGGISVYVLVFTMVAISKEIFQELDIPWHMYTCNGLAAGVITMSMIPGTPSIQNIMPTEYLGTTTMAAPILGLILAVLALIMGVGYIEFRLRQAQKRGEGFYKTGYRIAESDIKTETDIPNIPLWLCFLPSIVLFLFMNILKFSPPISLLITITVTYLLFYKHLKGIFATIQKATTNTLNAVGATCSVVGFGTVVAALPAFQYIISGLDKISGPPVVQLVIAVNIASAITGSSAGGLGVGLQVFGQRFLDQGIPAPVIHRLAVVSAGGLDSLPHNGVVINSLAVMRLTHKESYLNTFVTSVVIPIICAFVGAMLYQMGIW